MKKLFMLIFIIMVFSGIAGCPSSDDPAPNFVHTSIVTEPDTGNNNTSNGNTLGGDTLNGGQPSSVPEPASLILLGIGLVGLAAFGRNKIFK
jgi:hypothetical protein